jgi:hypothetical protein
MSIRVTPLVYQTAPEREVYTLALVVGDSTETTESLGEALHKPWFKVVADIITTIPAMAISSRRRPTRS